VSKLLNDQTIRNLLAVLVAAVLAMVTLKAVEIGVMQKRIEYNRHLIEKTNRRISLMLADRAPSDYDDYVLEQVGGADDE